MAYVLTSVSGNLISAASASFAPTNGADVSAIASAYVESGMSSKQDTLTFGYDDSAISSINGSALAGGGGASYTSPSGTIIVGADTLEGTDSGVGVTYLTSFQKSGYFNTAYGKSASGSSNYPTVFNLSGSAGTLYMSVSSNGVHYTSIYVDELNGTVVIPSGSWTIAKYNSVPMYWTAENYYSDTANVQLAHKSDITVTSLTRGRIYDYNVSPATTSTSVSAINGEPILAMSATSASQSLYARYNINGTPLTAMITDTPYSEKGTIHVTGLDVEGSDSAFFPAPYESASSVTLTPYEWGSSFSAQHWSKSFNVSTGDKISRIDFSAGNNYGLVTVEMSFYPDKRAATSFYVAPYQTGVYEFKVPFYAEYVNITASSNYSDSAISSVTLTAYSQDAGTVVPLAHASALPTYGYDGTAITAIDGSAIGGGGGVDSATVSAIASSYAESAASSKLDESATGDFYSTSNPSSFVDSAYVDSAVSGKADSSALSSYALSADVSGTVDLVSTQSANWGGSALALSAGPGVKLEKSGNVLVASTDETLLWRNTEGKLTQDLTFPLALSEPITNFERVKFLYGGDSYVQNAHWIEFEATDNNPYTLYDFRCDGPSTTDIFWRLAKFTINGTAVTNTYNSTINLNTSFAGAGYNTGGFNYLVKIVGINRISGS